MFALLTETTRLFQDALPSSVQVAACPGRDGRARRVISACQGMVCAPVDGRGAAGQLRPRGCVRTGREAPGHVRPDGQMLTRAARVVRLQKATTDYCRHYHDCTEHTSVDAFNQRW